MTLIDGDKIITAQLYDEQHEEFMEKKMSIIDCVNTYSDEGVTTADDVLDKIRAEIEALYINLTYKENSIYKASWGLRKAMDIIDKYKAESEK